MALTYKEAAFPVDYRQAEMRQIMAALYRLRSIAITGLAGMGKSNVVRFIVSHPQVRARYLKERADDYAFVHVDCAGLARGEEESVLLSPKLFALLAALAEARGRVLSADALIASVYGNEAAGVTNVRGLCLRFWQCHSAGQQLFLECSGQCQIVCVAQPGRNELDVCFEPAEIAQRMSPVWIHRFFAACLRKPIAGVGEIYEPDVLAFVLADLDQHVTGVEITVNDGAVDRGGQVLLGPRSEKRHRVVPGDVQRRAKGRPQVVL
jgi:hypothetical protein